MWSSLVLEIFIRDGVPCSSKSFKSQQLNFERSKTINLHGSCSHAPMSFLDSCFGLFHVFFFFFVDFPPHVAHDYGFMDSCDKSLRI